MKGRIRTLVRKEFRQIVRDRRTLAVLLLLPAVMLILFGYALSFDLRHIGLAVHDEDRTPESRNFVSGLVQSGYFIVREYVQEPSRVEGLLVEGEVLAVLSIPRGFGRNVSLLRDGRVQLLIDGSNATTAMTALSYFDAYSKSYLAGKVHDDEVVAWRVWYNPELESSKFFIPGLIGYILMVTTVISTALSVVKEKELGSIEQLIVSPLSSLELILGKTIPYMLIALASTIGILMAGHILFELEVKGSVLSLMFVTLLFIFTGLSMGILISTIAETQQVAFFIAIMSTMLPTFILSGFIFPIDSMPYVVQAITLLNPARYYMEAVRGIILKGTGLWVVWEQVCALVVYTGVLMYVANMRLKKQKVGS